MIYYFVKLFFPDAQNRFLYKDEKSGFTAEADIFIPSEKVVIEYGLSSQSVPMIWEAISTAPGLTSWFADDVRSDGKNFSFIWGKKIFI